MDIPIHPACRVLPPLSSDELDRLADEIRRHGLRRPIVLYEGAVLDGRGRLEACRRTGVPPRFTEWDGEGSPLEWVVSEHVGRRHLTPSQKAVIALGMIPLLEAEVREGRRRKQGRPKKRAQSCALFSGREKPGRRKLTEAAAALVGVSPRYVQLAKRLRKVFPELLPEIAAGKIGLPDAQRAARLSEVRRDRFVEALREPRTVGEELDIRRMLRQTCGPVETRLVPITSRPHKTPPPVKAAPDEIGRIQPTSPLLSRTVIAPASPVAGPGITLRITPAQLQLLDIGEAVEVRVGRRECLLVVRGDFRLASRRGRGLR